MLILLVMIDFGNTILHTRILLMQEKRKNSTFTHLRFQSMNDGKTKGVTEITPNALKTILFSSSWT
jgi:hypothetical protein